MLGDTALVRDEVGFLLVHQRYADRFFPGTSVLHTRIRYALFVPWILERLKARGEGGRAFQGALQREETRLAERLKGENYGVIGRLMLPDPSNQPPSYIYWTALSSWGLIGLSPRGRSWSRGELSTFVAAGRDRILKDDDGRPLRSSVWPVADDLPQVPCNWDGNEPLGFDLPPKERDYLARLIRGIRCPVDTRQRSLLALLVGYGVGGSDACWDDAVLDLAGPHRAALERAGRAASLAAVGRAVYAALVERQKQLDGRDVGRRHRNALRDVLGEHAGRVSGLNADLLIADLGPGLPPRVADVLRETLDWVKNGKRPPSSLLPVYRRAEIRRKGLRARLAEEQRGRDRRIEWVADDHPPAEPLHYRWNRVQLMLRDLEGA
jgi:hypothetical protein